MASTRRTKSKSLARENIACPSQFITYFPSTSSNTWGKRRKHIYHRETQIIIWSEKVEMGLQMAQG